MKALFSAAVISVSGFSTAAVSDIKMPASEPGTYVSAKELVSKVVDTVSGIGYQIPSSAGYKVLMIERTATGDAEVHMEMNDTIIIEKGHGEFLVGGSITGNHEIRPTEWRGGDISGGRRYNVSVGDLLLIPAGTPHKAFVIDGTFSYLTIKTPASEVKQK